MATSPVRPPQLLGRVFRGSTVIAAGLLTRKQLRSSAWVRIRQDVYADASLPLTYRLRISAVGLTVPAGGGFAGRSAAVLWGAVWTAGAADPVEYDGMWHGERSAFLGDRRRLNRLVAAGWVVLHVTADDLEHPERLLARLRSLLARRLAEMHTR